MRPVALLGIAVMTCAGACSAPDLGFGVALTIRADATVSDAQLTAVKSLSFTTTGNETDTAQSALGRPLNREERVVFRPEATTRLLTITVAGLDENSATILEGITPTLALTAGTLTDADVDLRAVAGQDEGVMRDGAVLMDMRGPTIDLPELDDAGFPTVTLAANPSTIVSGDMTALVWSSTDATSCTASGAWTGAMAPSGNMMLSPTATSTYMLTCTNGSQTSTTATATITVTAASGPVLAQYALATPAKAGNSTLQFKSLTKQGDVIWVAATTDNSAGIPTVTVSDSAGNLFAQLDQENDSPGQASLVHFWALIKADDTTTPDTITVAWPTASFKGVLIAEVSGVTASPLVGSNGQAQDGLPVGTNNISSHGITNSAAQAPSLLLSVSENVTTSGGTSAPIAGTNYKSIASIWDIGVDLATFETRTLTGSGMLAALFSAPAADSYVTVAVVFH